MCTECYQQNLTINFINIEVAGINLIRTECLGTIHPGEPHDPDLLAGADRDPQCHSGGLLPGGARANLGLPACTDTASCQSKYTPTLYFL